MKGLLVTLSVLPGFPSKWGHCYQSLRRWCHILELLYSGGSIDHVNFAETALMPLLWCDLSAWLSAVENIHVKHVICPVLVTTISPDMWALQRLMAFSDETMGYLLLTAVSLLFIFWYGAISLSLACLLCYLTSLFSYAIFHFLHIWEREHTVFTIYHYVRFSFRGAGLEPSHYP